MSNATLLAAAQNLAEISTNGGSSDIARGNIRVPILRSCKVAATANVTSLSGTTTIDGVALVALDPVLLTAQTTATQNGPWVVQAGAWTRPGDYTSALGALTHARSCLVWAGSTTANKGLWTLATVPTTVDTTSTTWTAPPTGGGGSGTNYQTFAVSGSVQTQRPTGNLIPATGITITPADNPGANRTDFTFAVTGSTPSRQQTLLTALGLVSETHRITVGNGSTTPATQAVTVGLLGLFSGDVVTNIIVCTTIAGSGAAPTLIRLGIADKSGKILAVTADVHASTSWTSTGMAVIPLSAPLTIPTTDGYYGCFVTNGVFGTTALQLASASGGTASRAGSISGASIAFGGQAAQADLPAVNSSLTLTTTTLPVWFGVS